ncbi:2,4-dihydroxyhept-2-ene-1,7-dioic acid aldolase [Ruminococcus sp. CLA-AA-H200]|uniref:2,4-dihydroxyhept-2-ene-1,7-dioic acid aldolase n=1 Tax=Ruminococcus turbiniformis TaxID=2881258 RepID=A0ABS8FVW4_9FIRM|nr:aldolase/citrate lyase family protein [Ruminococcus turbiniformis]MCC2254187.1 2,4-dihydroxyhept-2-ene-1,7-dioic acid aldolase [Ruminococcus turbiniformis]
MMKENKLRYHLDHGLPLLSTRLWSTWPFYTEVVGSTHNFDYIEFVGEYAPFTQYDLENIARAAELYEMGTMIKLDLQNRGYVAQKAIGAGFQSIMFVDHVNAEQVRESVEMVKPKTPGGGGTFGYPNRRFIGAQSHIPALDHAKRLDDIVLCFMIEKEEAVENIDEICSVPGVDMIQFGPNDYCMSRGWNTADHKEEFKAAERKCIRAALDHGVRPRCEIVHPEDAQYYMDLGVKDFSLGDQLAKLKEFWNGEGRTMRDMVNQLGFGEGNGDCC